MTYLIPCVKEHNIICSKVILSQISRNFFNLENTRLRWAHASNAILSLQEKSSSQRFTSCWWHALSWTSAQYLTVQLGLCLSVLRPQNTKSVSIYLEKLSLTPKTFNAASSYLKDSWVKESECSLLTTGGPVWCFRKLLCWHNSATELAAVSAEKWCWWCFPSGGNTAKEGMA